MRGNNLILFDKVNPMVIPFFNLGGRRWVETTIFTGSAIRWIYFRRNL